MSDIPKDDVQASDRHSGVRRAFVASLTGTALEWYDFAVYSAAAALVFGDLFFRVPSAGRLRLRPSR